MTISTSETVPYFVNAAAVLGVAPIVFGVNAILRPHSALSLLQFSAPPQPEGQRLTLSLIQIAGGRNIALGLMILAAWTRRDRRTLALTILATTPVAVIDGFVSRAQIGRGEWNHWAFIPLSLGAAGGLLGWY